MQGILHRNAGLQQEVAQLRVALSVSKGSEEALAKKVLGCEHTIESLVRASIPVLASAAWEDAGRSTAT